MASRSGKRDRATTRTSDTSSRAACVAPWRRRGRPTVSGAQLRAMRRVSDARSPLAIGLLPCSMVTANAWCSGAPT
eukprot:366551-Chlamydomonas_euryale.AAC.14